MRAEGTIAIIGGTLLVVGAALYASCAQQQAAVTGTDLRQVAAAAPPAPAAPAVRSSDGQLVKSQMRAWVDGRDLDARPPLTLRTTRVWTSVERTRVACGIRHGEEVMVTAVESSRKGDFARIERGACSGWLPARYLSLKKYPPTGDWQ